MAKTIDFSTLEKALAPLESALKSPSKNDLERDGVIQRFEYTFEAAWKFIQKILREKLQGQKGLSIMAFGSRVSGKPRQNSDLDLYIETTEPLSPALLAQLREALEESSLLFRVDLISCHRIPPEIKTNIEAMQKVSVI